MANSGKMSGLSSPLLSSTMDLRLDSVGSGKGYDYGPGEFSLAKVVKDAEMTFMESRETRMPAKGKEHLSTAGKRLFR